MTPTPTSSRKSMAARMSKINADDDWDKKPMISLPHDVYDGDEWDKEWDKSQRENYKKKITELQYEVERLKNDAKTKDNLVQSQAMNIKQLQMNSTQNEGLDSMKNEILQQMKLQFHLYRISSTERGRLLLMMLSTDKFFRRKRYCYCCL